MDTAGQFLRRHVDQLRSRHIPDSDIDSEIITDFGPTIIRNQQRIPSQSNANPTNINPSPITAPVRRSSRICIPVNRYAPLVSK